jgi:UDP-N-acetylmuramoyl-tripeptide--D-alanyl-D-alanine ligase
VELRGDRLEFGSMEEAMHRALGEQAARAVVRLHAFGPRSRRTAEAARAAGLADVSHTTEMPELVAQVKERLAPGDVLLVKGSRANQLERLVAALGSTPSQPGDAH